MKFIFQIQPKDIDRIFKVKEVDKKFETDNAFENSLDEYLKNNPVPFVNDAGEEIENPYCDYKENVDSYINADSDFFDSGGFLKNNPVPQVPIVKVQERINNKEKSIYTIQKDTPSIDRKNIGPVQGEKFFEMGSWPQTEVTDPNLLFHLNEMDSNRKNNPYWFRDDKIIYDSSFGLHVERKIYYHDYVFNKERYRRIIIGNSEQFYFTDNVNGYHEDESYWFKWEPIKWKIVSKSDKFVYAISCLILDSKPFNRENVKTEWNTSTIKHWLENDFFDNAFFEEEKNIINSIYLESATNIETLFWSGDLRDPRVKGTDYAKSQGLSINLNNGFSNWWAPEPSIWTSKKAHYICDEKIKSKSCSVDNITLGVRPTISIGYFKQEENK